MHNWISVLSFRNDTKIVPDLASEFMTFFALGDVF
jgi:hypothetical protein